MDLFNKSFSLVTNIELFVLYFFAIPHHLRTFLSPFKRMSVKSTAPGINLTEMGEVISFNLVSIGVGLILRLFLIFLGLLLMTAILVVSAVGLIVILAISPLLYPMLLYRSQAEARELESLKAHALEKPGEALFKILTTTPQGRFLTRKLVLETKDLMAFSNFAGHFSINSQIGNLPDLILALAADFPPFKNLLEQKLLDQTDLARIFSWYENLKDKTITSLFDHDSLAKIQGIGADWSYGYTNQLEKHQVTQSYSQFPRVVGRDNEVQMIEKTLAKTSQNSCVVIGEPGVGRHAVVDEFSRRLYQGRVLPDLVGHRTIYLDLKSALAGLASITDSRKIALDLLDEGRQAGNIILVIDDLDKFLETSGERMDLTDIFVQTLSDGRLRVVGVTSQQLYDKYISPNGTITKLFAPVTINPPDMETVYLEMELSICPVLSKLHKVEISYVAIKVAIQSADRFISSAPFPEKAINLMDEAVSFIKAEHPHMTMLWDKDIQSYLSAKTQIPIGNLNKDQKSKLANLETTLHQRIVGQDQAVSALAKAMRRAVLAVSAGNKPIGTFLFLGPTGVGKTETAKALAQSYFGSENRLVRLDMSEYQGEEGLEKLIGSTRTASPGQLTSAVANNPFAVVLLDEIEKSPPIILNLLLTLLDEGYITDATGRKISAKQNIIIGTSNAGALLIKNKVDAGIGGDALEKELVSYVQQEKIFSPEFLNRFDGVIVFRPLTTDQMREVTKLLLAALVKRVAEKKINLSFSDNLIDRIVTEGYDPAFGARSIKRFIQDVVEDEVSQILLSSKIQPGMTIEI